LITCGQAAHSFLQSCEIAIPNRSILGLVPMRSFAVLVLVAASFVATPVFAGNQRAGKAAATVQKRSAKARFQEADGFLGLKFGVPLTSQLPECIHSAYGEHEPKPAFCYGGLSTGELGYAQLEQPPNLGVAYSAVVLLWAGNVEDVCLRFSSEDFAQMLKLLIARFGPPSVVDAAISEGDSGDMLYEGKVYKWSGSRVTIELSEYGDKPHESKVVFATNRYLRALRE
jgi:hypothetical protein